MSCISFGSMIQLHCQAESLLLEGPMETKIESSYVRDEKFAKEFYSYHIYIISGINDDVKLISAFLHIILIWK